MYFVKKDNDMRSIFDGFNNLFYGDTRLLKTDIEETEDAYFVTVDVPGIKKESINIDFSEDTLTISVKAQDDTIKSYVRRERYNVSGSRSFYLKDADDSSIKAKLENGLLHISINKKKVFENNNKINISIE